MTHSSLNFDEIRYFAIYNNKIKIFGMSAYFSVLPNSSQFAYSGLPYAYPISQAECVMPQLKLSKSIVDHLAAEKADVVFWDDSLPGFGVRVKPTGIKTYIIQYRNRTSGRSRRKTIGRHGPLLGFQAARTIARGYLADVMRGGDPVAEAHITRAAPTIRDLAEDYLSKHAVPKKRPNSVKNDRVMLDRFILPSLVKYKVCEVRHQDVQVLHNSMCETPYQANRTLSLLSKMFELSVRWGWRPDNPARGVEKYYEDKRHRWLSDAELIRLTDALDQHPNQLAANAIRLQLLTGARIGEILTAKWADFDFDRDVWIKPSHHTKQKRTEYLPLSSAAIELLRIQRPLSSSEYLFPGRDPEKPLQSLRRVWKQICSMARLSDYRLHDNRHTHASHLVSSGLSLPIVGRLLGHTNPSTTQRYAHLADDPLRQAAEMFAGKMTGSGKAQPD
ncbi:tyrosine-type recombinase/integrase [Litoreibacter janthinus]|uniref:Site-specific recombinase XerD n=1 Tax=Litoreibacter janthinus TaxID=670154 RepID=A0A1I6H0N5_9RHOB|nr:site-specific integrase [Litoreibacter janthinus]SFR47851.1 Site-specific recombinase XerD [Litoreibacter janthinus]